MTRYRIILVSTAGADPCRWQAQERVWVFFWRNMCGRTSSATTQGNHILMHGWDIAQAAQPTKGN